MLVLWLFSSREKKLISLKKGHGVTTKQKLMVDLEIKVVLLDSIVKEGVNSFQE